MPSPILPRVLSQLLDGHRNKEYLVSGFTNGFMLNFEGKFSALTCNNAISALNFPDVVEKKLYEEISLGRIAGPFINPPFSNLKCSPLAVRQKQQSNKYRLLHNLSFPYDSRSVNSNIPKSFSSVNYQTLDDAIVLINNSFYPAFLSKVDIADAFRIIPLHRSQYPLTGIYWNNKYYFDKCLPMGCSSSCKIFETFSDSLQWIMSTKFNCPNIVKVLDDFIFITHNITECNRYLATFKTLARHIGLPLASHKTVEPTTNLTFLGIDINTISMTIHLPVQKTEKYLNNVRHILSATSVSLRDLRSLLGQLQHASTVVKVGRPFLRRLYDQMAGKCYPNDTVHLSSGCRADLDVWSKFLQTLNRKVMIREFPLTPAESINLFSDACQKGFGATYGSQWIQGSWPITWQSFNICVLELYPLFVIVSIFANKLKDSRILLHSDNIAVVDSLNKQSCKHPMMMAIIRPFVLCLLKHNISMTAAHIPGFRNNLCDFLSRQEVTPEFLSVHKLNRVPTTLPIKLLPQNFVFT